MGKWGNRPLPNNTITPARPASLHFACVFLDVAVCGFVGSVVVELAAKAMAFALMPRIRKKDTPESMYRICFICCFRICFDCPLVVKGIDFTTRLGSYIFFPVGVSDGSNISMRSAVHLRGNAAPPPSFIVGCQQK